MPWKTLLVTHKYVALARVFNYIFHSEPRIVFNLFLNFEQKFASYFYKIVVIKMCILSASVEQCLIK